MPHVTAIILAAGQSARMDNINKLLLPFRDKTVLECVVDTVAQAPVEEVVVVTGHEDRQIRDVLSGYPVRVAYNPEYAFGMSTSIRRGVLGAHPDAQGYMVFLADMPLVKPVTLTRLIEVFRDQTKPSIVIATSEGKRGNPVIFHSAFRKQLLQLRGDLGARALFEDHADAVVEVDVQDTGIFMDIDTRASYDDLRRL